MHFAECSNLSGPEEKSVFDKKLNEIRDRLYLHIKAITGNEKTHIYHNRHSSINYLILLMFFSENMPFFEKQLAEFYLTNNVLKLAKKVREMLTGSEDITHKVLPAISKVVGHVYWKTTIEVYCHVLELLNFMLHEQQIMCGFHGYSNKGIYNFLSPNITNNSFDKRIRHNKNSKLKEDTALNNEVYFF